MRSVTIPSLRDRIRAQLADLKMPGALEALDDILRAIDGGTMQAPAALEALLGAQIALRNNRRLAAAMRPSRLPGPEARNRLAALLQLAVWSDVHVQVSDRGLADRADPKRLAVRQRRQLAWPCARSTVALAIGFPRVYI
jgi:hypothetical protein